MSVERDIGIITTWTGNIPGVAIMLVIPACLAIMAKKQFPEHEQGNTTHRSPFARIAYVALACGRLCMSLSARARAGVMHVLSDLLCFLLPLGFRTYDGRWHYAILAWSGACVVLFIVTKVMEFA